MCTTLIDLEWSITKKKWNSETSGKSQDYTDKSPYCPDNKLVSAGIQTSKGDSHYLFFNHRDFTGDIDSNRKVVQEVLDNTDLLVAYNIASDLAWLKECGFKYEGKIYDPMIFEYIKSFGMKTSLKLKDVVKVYGLEDKSGTLEEYFAKGVNTDEIPMDELEEYGRLDVKLLGQLYMKQKELLKSDPKLASTINILREMNSFVEVLVDMERNGIKIDLRRLLEIEEDYRKELNQTNQRLKELIKEVMGTKPINIDSPDDLSQVFYSFRVINKPMWSMVFNIGTEFRNGVRKKKYPPKLSKRETFTIIKNYTRAIYRTRTERCIMCDGKGYSQGFKINGEPKKRLDKCKECNGVGLKYIEMMQPAGFGLTPPGPAYASKGGFSTSSDVLEMFLKSPEVKGKAREFITRLLRRNAIDMYLSTFVEGIQKNLYHGYVHMNYNQCVTATGRLSSRFHNLPKGKTFPIKEAICSRFEGGEILNVDFAQLEFRTAVTLADDDVGAQDILDKVDVHTNTARILLAKQDIDKEERDDAKQNTFKPLYGGSSGTDAEKAYYAWFLNRYSKIRDWQIKLGDQALTRKFTQSPSGRIYAFPYTKMQQNGRVSGFTQIANYQVQGFGFDIVMVSITGIHEALKSLQSKLIMTIHDSVVIDVHPDEKAQVIQIVKNVLDKVDEIVYNKYSYKLKVPLAYDISCGKSWGKQEKI